MAYKQTEWESKFLEIYGQSGNVTLAALGAGVGRSTVYERRQKHKKFREKMELRREEAIAILEGEAFSRARKQSDTLLIFLLKNLNPSTYGDKIQHSGKVTFELSFDDSSD